MVAHFDALPRLHGLRDRVPVGRPVRPADRGHPRAGRAAPHRAAGRPGAARGDLRAVPLPAAAAAAARPAARLPGAAGCSGWCGAAAARPAAPTLAAMESLAPPLRPAPRAARARRGAAGRARAVVGMLTGCVQRRVLPRRQRRHRAGARRRGLRGGHPPQPGLLRGAVACTTDASAEAQRVRPRARSRRSTPPASSTSWSTRPAAGRRMKEYADLLADDPAYAERAPALRRQGPRRRRVPGRARAGRAAAPAPGDGRLPRRLPPRRTPRASAPSRARCCARIPGLELREIAEPELCCGSAGVYNLLNPEPAGRARRPQGRERARHRRRPAGHRQPRLPHAGRRGAARAPGRASRWRTPSRCSTRRSAATPSRRCDETGRDRSGATRSRSPVHGGPAPGGEPMYRTGPRPGRRFPRPVARSSRSYRC